MPVSYSVDRDNLLIFIFIFIKFYGVGKRDQVFERIVKCLNFQFKLEYIKTMTKAVMPYMHIYTFKSQRSKMTEKQHSVLKISFVRHVPNKPAYFGV